jgi:hypothetical protein
MGAMSSLCRSGIYLSEGLIVKTGDMPSVIDAYLSNVAHINENIAIFKDDQNKDINILSVSIHNTKPNTSTTFDISDEIEIHVNYIVRKDMVGTNIFVGLDHYGTNIARLFDIDYDKTLFLLRKRGRYTLVIKIPPKFLNIGNWAISVDSGISNVTQIDVHHHCLNFTIVSNTEDLTHSGLSKGGAVIPPFTVETIQSENDEYNSNNTC